MSMEIKSEMPAPIRNAITVEEVFGKIPQRDMSRSWNSFLLELNKRNWPEAYKKLLEFEGFLRMMTVDSDYKNSERWGIMLDNIKLIVLVNAPDEFKRLNGFEMSQDFVRELSNSDILITPVV
jgi:hypothetical protein